MYTHEQIVNGEVHDRMIDNLEFLLYYDAHKNHDYVEILKNFSFNTYYKQRIKFYRNFLWTCVLT